MIELLAGLLVLIALAASITAFTYRRSFFDALAVAKESERYLMDERKVTKALENRITVLKGHNEALEKERNELERKIGRMEAERRAAQPKRGKGGRFVAKKPKPVVCG